MPKAAPYRLSWDLKQGTYTLHNTRSQRVFPVAPDSHAWFDWLAGIPSFAFSGQHGPLTVRQETRSAGIYWYAYRRVGEKMAKRYLGRTTELTLARLEQVAAQLAEAALSPGQGTLARGVSGGEKPDQHVMTSPIASLPSVTHVRSVVPSLPESQRDVPLVTRLHIPHLRTQLVRRTQLIQQLQQGMEAPLTLVSAPAGFGKTTLLAQWLAESARPVAWVSLEPADNDPVRFLSAVIAALQQLDPQLGTSALALFHSPPLSPPPPPEAVVALLVADLSHQAPRDCVLVLDDYQVIETKALSQALAYLVEHTPPHLHVIIATRTDPALPLARMRARGQLCEVRVAQLQFLPEETSAFLHTVMELDLSAEECATLQNRTEGWIAGLQLAALSLRGRVDVQQFLGEFTGSHRHIIDYLTEEVLARQPEAVQSFLLRTALLDRFTSPLCNAVTGSADGEQMLGYLERANLFLIPLDERRQWYRYHHLFAEALRARVLREVGTEGRASLYLRASAWYEQNGMPALAIEAALSARDFGRAARFIDPDAPLIRSMLVGFEARTLIRWLECFPQEVLFTDARLCLVYAFSLGTSETSDAHAVPLAVAERLFQAQGNRKGLGQASTLRALAATERGNGAQAVLYGAQAFQLLPEDAMLERSIISSTLAEGYRLAGEVAEAQRVVTEARPLHEQFGNASSILSSTITLGDLLVMQGHLHEAAGIYGSVLEAAGERQSFAILALIGLGNILRERNELDGAEAQIEKAVTFASQTRDKLRLARASLMHARIIQTRGDAERTREVWSSALRLAQACVYTGLMEQAQAYQVRSWLRQGQMEAVIHWQKTCPLSADAPADYQHEVIALTLARVLLAQGEAAHALRLVERWHLHARAQGRTGSEIELLVLSALAYAQQDKAEQAVQLLRQALLLASPEGYVRVFVDEGVPMAVLLHMVLSRWKGKTEADEVRRLLSVWETEQAAAGPYALAMLHRELPLAPLSGRERKVLRGLVAGLSNAEIAAELVVSINTIRTQTRSIYHKLNVKNRHEAVALARQWRLL
ncbi:LuxR family transcriptional regulator [Dictyobacter alpinus]|uniref:LuxR family transcriptional regulator n=2 Tax=Dictyobacter alpinus TaxID=2014873 RepID=A0A402BFB3_9CHLR|nr:LuxR family transcriptional regulator [Dictyobacter alpinus]